MSAFTRDIRESMCEKLNLCMEETAVQTQGYQAQSPGVGRCSMFKDNKAGVARTSLLQVGPGELRPEAGAGSDHMGPLGHWRDCDCGLRLMGHH